MVCTSLTCTQLYNVVLHPEKGVIRADGFHRCKKLVTGVVPLTTVVVNPYISSLYWGEVMGRASELMGWDRDGHPMYPDQLFEDALEKGVPNAMPTGFLVGMALGALSIAVPGCLMATLVLPIMNTLLMTVITLGAGLAGLIAGLIVEIIIAMKNPSIMRQDAGSPWRGRLIMGIILPIIFTVITVFILHQTYFGLTVWESVASAAASTSAFSLICGVLVHILQMLGICRCMCPSGGTIVPACPETMMPHEVFNHTIKRTIIRLLEAVAEHPSLLWVYRWSGLWLLLTLAAVPLTLFAALWKILFKELFEERNLGLSVLHILSYLVPCVVVTLYWDVFFGYPDVYSNLVLAWQLISAEIGLLYTVSYNTASKSGGVRGADGIFQTAARIEGSPFTIFLHLQYYTVGWREGRMMLGLSDAGIMPLSVVE
ncbi:hypothetical protein CEUSTIGMA_g3284.t1 [Chlamydomonas eustigma]|uniref:Uncharacterized protein n=1 Tax=Chlamydomonas eustigma TaxID=1157962 RepID=A0A250WYD8_9CHLO|nr:hypothetical protein CEUSTIGMA_g3284.t1 [Chlamydomonas eustigma]|eukprot:GAX75841.1 hypothetical protein CEUSTIGMA_g3284.t1 [Chlamydomonas eustigma]